MRRLRVHDTRHTYAALMLRQGKSIEYVSQQLGHSKIDITIRFYAHFKPGVNRHHANDFEARIRAFEVADGCGFSACEGTRTAPRPHQWVASAVEVSENLVPPG